MRDIAKRYQAIVGLQHLMISRDKRYLKHLRMGYFEPIPLAWSQNPYGPLTQSTSSLFYDDAGGTNGMIVILSSNLIFISEERLYWTLNHAVHDGKPRLKSMPRTEAQEVIPPLSYIRCFTHFKM